MVWAVCETHAPLSGPRPEVLTLTVMESLPFSGALSKALFGFHCAPDRLTVLKSLLKSICYCSRQAQRRGQEGVLLSLTQVVAAKPGVLHTPLCRWAPALCHRAGKNKVIKVRANLACK